MPAAVKAMFHPHRSNRPKRLDRPPPKRLVGPFPCTNGVAMTDLGAMGFQPFAKKKCDDMVAFPPEAVITAIKNRGTRTETAKPKQSAGDFKRLYGVFDNY